MAEVGPSVASGLVLLGPRVPSMVGTPFSSGGPIIKASCCDFPCGRAQDSWIVGRGSGGDGSQTRPPAGPVSFGQSHQCRPVVSSILPLSPFSALPDLTWEGTGWGPRGTRRPSNLSRLDS